LSRDLIEPGRHRGLTATPSATRTPEGPGASESPMGFMLDFQARFFRLWRSIPDDSHRLAWKGAAMENVLVAAVALFLGFNLGVLVVRLHCLSDADDVPGRIQAHAHTVSAWWR